MSKFNFFDRAVISNANFSDHVVSWSFNSFGILLLNESAITADIVQYSFDGSTLHGELPPNTVAAGLAFDNRFESAIYFRLVDGASTTIIRVEAWA